MSFSESIIAPYLELTFEYCGKDLKAALAQGLPKFEQLHQAGGILYRYITLSDGYQTLQEEVAEIQKSGSDKYFACPLYRIQASPVIDHWRMAFHNGVLVYDGISPNGLIHEATSFYRFPDPSNRQKALIGVVSLLKPRVQTLIGLE